MAVDIFRLTADFNREVIGYPTPARPSRLSEARKAWAKLCLLEEVKEFDDVGKGPLFIHSEQEMLEDEVDALIDLIYFAGGRLYEMGVDGGAHFLEVHCRNMAKERGEKSTRHGSAGYDAVKPEGWVGPDHASVLTRRPKVILLGHARHGKDTVAELLRDVHGFAFQSSSMFCAERVLMPYFAAHGVPYASVEECYEDRVNHRSTWFERIEDYNRDDPSRLCRELFETNDVYVGMRSAYEFAEARKHADFVVWVDAMQRKDPEPRSSFNIDFDPETMILLDNNGPEVDLVNNVHALVDHLREEFRP
jgi:hypothetical protein